MWRQAYFIIAKRYSGDSSGCCICAWNTALWGRPHWKWRTYNETAKRISDQFFNYTGRDIYRNYEKQERLIPIFTLDEVEIKLP
ncbi:hypothetical protein CISG_09250 [Coccidioides immitis RMSCC 3703]|uniref:Uncharacterized protein n=1 Tax=Coccidioides immitis RMSCC 3703 TaxID=454286 RepID=A0A0J8U463_COCIT|nr:hypothetical protein CISG_09250 [Coccidioides immitis RMSCC 3703]